MYQKNIIMYQKRQEALKMNKIQYNKHKKHHSEAELLQC